MTELARVDHLPESRKATKAEAAEFFGVSLPTIDAWVRGGCPVLRRGSHGVSWTLDLLAIAQWRFSPQDDGSCGNERLDPEDMEPRDRRDWYAGTQKKIEIEEMKKNLIPAEEVRDEYSALAKRFVRGLDMVFDMAETELELSPAQAEKLETIIATERQEIFIGLGE